MVGFVFGFEHVLLVVAVFLQLHIHPVPKWVQIALQRRKYLALKRKAVSTVLQEHYGDNHQ